MVELDDLGVVFFLLVFDDEEKQHTKAYQYKKNTYLIINE
jgi:hypothetical protein